MAGLTEEEYCSTNPYVPECPEPCCRAYTAECMSCSEGVTVEEYCRINPYVPECPDIVISKPQPPVPCCNDFTLECEACNAGVSEDEFCRSNRYSPVCNPYVLSHPDNCLALRFKKEIMHGEMGPRDRKCCWYGKWEDKSKCEKTCCR